jgi:hypothetical protein
MINLPLSDRHCGECDVCCTILIVQELDKPEYTNCHHQNKGCMIYDTRPSICRKWSCSWVLNIIPGDETIRPNNLGLMFYPAPKENDLGFAHMLGQEVWEGASDSEMGKSVINYIASHMLVLIRKYGSNTIKFAGPKDQQEQFLKLSK